MKQIEELFHVRRARSHLFSDYSVGDVPFIGNGFGDNAVVAPALPLPPPKGQSDTSTGVIRQTWKFQVAVIPVPPWWDGNKPRSRKGTYPE